MRDDVTVDPFEARLTRLIEAYTEPAHRAASTSLITAAAVARGGGSHVLPRLGLPRLGLRPVDRRLAWVGIAAVLAAALAGALLVGGYITPDPRPKALIYESGGHAWTIDARSATTVDLGPAIASKSLDNGEEVLLLGPTEDAPRLSVVHADGSLPRHIDEPVIFEMNASADGRWAIGGDATELRLVDLQTGTFQQLGISGWKDTGPPSWDPTGLRAVVVVRQGVGTDLAVVSPDGGGSGVTLLAADGPSYKGAVAWGPTGEIAFWGAKRVEVIRPDGTGLRVLQLAPPDPPVFASQLVWRPDGQALAAVVADSGVPGLRWRVELINFTSGTATTIVQPAGDAAPWIAGWYADGSLLGVQVVGGGPLQWLRADGTVATTQPLPADASMVEVIP